jgi:hypothetical protein
VYGAREAFREQNNIRTLPFPPKSPDLNPIENLWHLVKDELRRGPKPSNLVELKLYVKKAWLSVPPEHYRSLIKSMPNRIQAVIEAKGGQTKY